MSSIDTVVNGLSTESLAEIDAVAGVDLAQEFTEETLADAANRMAATEAGASAASDIHLLVEYGVCKLSGGKFRPVTVVTLVRYPAGFTVTGPDRIILPDDKYRNTLQQGASLRARANGIKYATNFIADYPALDITYAVERLPNGAIVTETFVAEQTAEAVVESVEAAEAVARTPRQQGFLAAAEDRSINPYSEKQTDGEDWATGWQDYMTGSQHPEYAELKKEVRVLEDKRQKMADALRTALEVTETPVAETPAMDQLKKELGMTPAEDRAKAFEQKRKAVKAKVEQTVAETGAPGLVNGNVIRVKGQDEARKVIEAAIRLKHNVMLEGHTGVGKTTLLYEIAHDYNKTLVRCNLNGQTGKEDFVGQHLVRATETGSETYFVYGVLAEALKSGDWMVNDEINAALPEILFVLQSALDDDRSIRLVEKGGEVITAHPEFRFFATMNPSDEYAGTKELNGALKSRFGTWVTIDYPEASVEQDILCERTGIDPAQAAIMVQVAQTLRKAKESNLVYTTVSTRDLLRWAELTRELKNRALAFKYTVLNRSQLDAPYFLTTAKQVDVEFEKLLKALGGKKNTEPGQFILRRIEEGMQAIRNAEETAKKIEADAMITANTIIKGAEEKAKSIEAGLAQKEKELRARLAQGLSQMLTGQIENALEEPGTSPASGGKTQSEAYRKGLEAAAHRWSKHKGNVDIPYEDGTIEKEEFSAGFRAGIEQNDGNLAVTEIEPGVSKGALGFKPSELKDPLIVVSSKGLVGVAGVSERGLKTLVFEDASGPFVLTQYRDGSWTVRDKTGVTAIATMPDLYHRVLHPDGRVVEAFSTGYAIEWRTSGYPRLHVEASYSKTTLTEDAYDTSLHESYRRQGFVDHDGIFEIPNRTQYLEQLRKGILATPTAYSQALAETMSGLAQKF